VAGEDASAVEQDGAAYVTFPQLEAISKLPLLAAIARSTVSLLPAAGAADAAAASLGCLSWKKPKQAAGELSALGLLLQYVPLLDAMLEGEHGLRNVQQQRCAFWEKLMGYWQHWAAEDISHLQHRRDTWEWRSAQREHWRWRRARFISEYEELHELLSDCAATAAALAAVCDVAGLPLQVPLRQQLTQMERDLSSMLRQVLRCDEDAVAALAGVFRDLNIRGELTLCRK
jgi:hypothetical protein